MNVRDVMSSVPVTIPDAQSCYEAAVRMSRFRVHHLPVLADDRTVAGIVTDRDLRATLFLTVARASEACPVNVEATLQELPVRDVMTTPALTVAPGDELAAAVRVMAEERIGSLLVVENERLVGILTDTDVLRVLFRRRLFCRSEVEAILLPAA